VPGIFEGKDPLIPAFARWSSVSAVKALQSSGREEERDVRERSRVLRFCWSVGLERMLEGEGAGWPFTINVLRGNENNDSGTPFISPLFTSVTDVKLLKEEKVEPEKEARPVASICRSFRFVSAVKLEGIGPAGRELSPVIEKV
jgi:hypothetical protein